MDGRWYLRPSSFGNPGTFQTLPTQNAVADPACGTALPAQEFAELQGVEANLIHIVNVDTIMFI